METEGYDTFRTWNEKKDGDFMRTKLRQYYDFDITDEETVLEHGGGNAYVKVTDTTITLNYDPDIRDPDMNAWDWAAHQAFGELSQYGESFIDLDRMLEPRKGPAETLLEQYDVRDWENW